ncbi:alpha/beta fold hydrolase [Flammeovirgaceae bacterium SG7u.111]|nr:alpha/beta fold hydrolase [Flammeovirgaceae bacterium SG7u.132]WPO35045.1 alpha/beta fold hydrolase [Flammeovirgaceae bacterium SG7u.111]
MNKKLDFVLTSKHDNRKFIGDIRFKKDGKAKPIILFVHGFKGFKDWGPFNLVADFFAKNDFVFAKINLSHNGTTPESPIDFADLEAFGNNNFTIEQDDIGTAIDFLLSYDEIKDEADMEQLNLIGHSRGGGMVVLKTAADARIRKTATWAAICDVAAGYKDETVIENWEKDGVIHIWNSRTEQHMPLYFQIYENYIQNREKLSIEKNAKTITQPVILFHGTEDPTVPYAAAESLHSWIPNATFVTLEGSGHTFEAAHPWNSEKLPENLQTVVEKTAAFFKQ